ncbi:CxxxxCH/CxxCH domain c-type cytochrome [Geobacter metallireducens]|uniref:CxxxxCH/CxxCH domain c-type cytochrome n=1 Tax=Geobacter metallireducens TaxID=28232 RepID=UPI0021C60ED4|nr:CxxxxCH/CxxCH domain-containing protein [Geobacter metallireducens]
MLLFVGVLSLAGPAEGALECYSCHGSSSPVDYRPADNAYRNISSGGFQGNHRTHMDASAVPGSCSQCHPGSASYTASHRNGSIRISSRINNSPLATAFRNHTSSPQSATPTPGSCTNINCHFEAATPIWGSSPLAAPTGCSACHGAAPSDGNHPAVSGSGKKHGDYLGTGTGSCASCHTDHTAEARPFAHATSVAKRALVVKFTKTPNSGGTYSGVLTYPGYLPSQNPPRNGTCANLYCHSDGRGGAPFTVARWSDSGTIQCYSCHRGRSSDSTEANCTSVGGTWDSDKTKCSPYLNMSSNGHNKLVGSHWIRKYPCSYCHSATADSAGNIIDTTKHVNGTRDVKMASQWNIVGRTDASYDSTTKVCSNVYCHSDGTTDPETVRAFPWTATKAGCNDCHGHLRGGCSDTGCHDGRIEGGKVWTLPSRFGALGAYAFPTGQEWMEAMPMFANQGAGTPRANSHPRHSETNFSCDNCHAATVIGDCASCHSNGIPIGSMGESSHLNGTYHVNKTKDVVFKDGGSYNPVAKTCSNTKCHTSGTDPVWGGGGDGGGHLPRLPRDDRCGPGRLQLIQRHPGAHQPHPVDGVRPRPLLLCRRLSGFGEPGGKFPRQPLLVLPRQQRSAQGRHQSLPAQNAPPVRAPLREGVRLLPHDPQRRRVHRLPRGAGRFPGPPGHGRRYRFQAEQLEHGNAVSQSHPGDRLHGRQLP